MKDIWQFDIRPAPGLPALSWVARVRATESTVEVTCGNRAAIAVAKLVGAERLVGGLLARRRRLVHFDPEIGTLLLRRAVSVIQPRYAALERHTE